MRDAAPTPHLWPTTERCGLWVGLGHESFICMRLPDHGGECLPTRAEVMRLAEHHERRAQDLHDAVTAIDTDGGWPDA